MIDIQREYFYYFGSLYKKPLQITNNDRESITESSTK